MQVLLGNTGYTYCRECISGWLERNNTNPHDRTELTSRELIVNWNMRWTVDAYNTRQVCASLVHFTPLTTHCLALPCYLPIRVPFLSLELYRLTSRPADSCSFFSFRGLQALVFAT